MRETSSVRHAHATLHMIVRAGQWALMHACLILFWIQITEYLPRLLARHSFIHIFSHYLHAVRKTIDLLPSTFYHQPSTTRIPSQHPATTIDTAPAELQSTTIMHFFSKLNIGKKDPSGGQASGQSGSSGSSRRRFRDRIGLGSRSPSPATSSQSRTDSACMHAQPDSSYSGPHLVTFSC